jgi:hypothetical protein
LTNGLASAVAAGTLGAHDHDALMESHKPSPLTGVALLWLSSRFCPAPLAHATGASALQLYNLHIYRATLEVPLTASLKSMSYLSVMS